MSGGLWRLLLALSVMSLILFGGLGWSIYYLVIWEPWKCLGCLLAVHIGASVLPRPVGWVMTLGMRPEDSRAS